MLIDRIAASVEIVLVIITSLKIVVSTTENILETKRPHGLNRND